MSGLTLCEEHLMFGGRQQRWQHTSATLGCEMKFSLFLPPAATAQPVPLLWCLAGLTCTDENFSVKSGAQRLAAGQGIALIMPDTSPRGSEVPDDEQYDLGQGAGFYLNATQAPWDRHYRMYDYLTQELPALLAEHFSFSDRQAIMGHSMGATVRWYWPCVRPDVLPRSRLSPPSSILLPSPGARKPLPPIWERIVMHGVSMMPAC